MDYYLGEIRAFGGNYAPQDWVICNGQSLNINDYEPLYTLIGTTYGGDGVTKFNVPDLRGRLAIDQGNGTGLTPRSPGQQMGSETVQLNSGNIPNHSHSMNISNAAGTTTLPAAGSYLANLAIPAATGTKPQGYISANASPAPTVKAMNAATISSTTSTNIAHNNIMPVVAITYMICVNGLYPEHA